MNTDRICRKCPTGSGKTEAIKYLPQLGNRGAYLYQKMSDKLVEHKQYIHQYGQDLPEVSNWKWED